MARTLLASYLALLLLPACYGREQGEASPGTCAAEEDCTALMQLNVKVQPGALAADVESNEPYPVGRTIISTDPRATAEWMVKYYANATLLPPLPGCDHAERAAVKHDLGQGGTQLLIFIRDESLPRSDTDPFAMIPRVQETVRKLLEMGSNYTWWYDNHDGFQMSTYDVAASLADGDIIRKMYHYLENGKLSDDFLVYLLPHTMYVAQNDHGGLSVEGVQELGMDDCRLSQLNLLQQNNRSNLLEDGEVSTSRPPHPWAKATYASADPASASAFAADVLGAEPGYAPYPWPPVENCTAATWAKFPVSGFELHFVYAPEYQAHTTTIQDYMDQVLAARNLSAGVFDPYMHNSLILTVKDLDPYVERLRARSLDFLLLDVGAGEFALFTTMPGNDITVQLRSSKVTAASPSELSVCAQMFPIG